MEVKVNIDLDTINANTETVSKSSNIIIGGGELSLCHKESYTDFCNKIPSILKDKRNVEHKITTSVSGEEISWVTILSNSATSSVFDLFKSMGMYMPKLTIGVNRKTNTIYTSNKFCKDLSKYSDTQKAAFVMYMLTVEHFVHKTYKLLMQYEYDGTTGILKHVAGKSNDFDECLRKFTEEETWYVKDSGDDSYAEIIFCNSAHITINDQCSSTSFIPIGLVKNQKGNFAGIASTKLGSKAYTFLVTDGAVYTDFDLCNIELSADSVCAAIANAFQSPVILKKVEKLPLTNNMTLIDLEGEEFNEFAKTNKLSPPLVNWFNNMIAKAAPIADIEAVSYLCKEYGINMPTGSISAASLTQEEMKKTYADDEYAQELYKQIQPYYDTYKLGKELDANIKGFSNGALYSMAFVGDSGTGKSTAARVIPVRCGIPYISVNFSVNIEEADLFGSMVPNPKKSKPEEPEFIWADGIITKAVRYGYCVILEELNFARPGVLGKLNSLLDENRQIDLATGEIVRAHPNFRIIATCNIAYEGTNRFNKALINRFDDVTVFKDLPRSEAIDVIKNRTGYNNTVKIAKVYDVYEALKKFAAEQNVNAIVSMRQLLNIFTKGKYYSSAKDAIQRIMINGAFIEDAEYQKVFEGTVFAAFDLKFKI